MYLKLSTCQMYSLFLDHSFLTAVLALFENGKVVKEILLNRLGGEQPCLFWQKMLEEVGCTLQDVDFFVCGSGPGSYTGMRGAAAAVKAVSLVQKKPIVAVPSLILLCPQKEGSYLLIKDAKIAGFYGQIVRIHKEVLTCNVPEVLSCDAVAEYARQGFLPVCEESDAVATKVGAIPIQLQSRIVAQYAFEAFYSKDVYRPENLPLLYLRKTQAEIEIQLPKRGI